MRSIRIHPLDNVAVALEELSPEITTGHKFALADIRAGENIIKYGMPIGRAICDIKSGEHVHTHNMKTNLEGILDYRYEPVPVKTAAVESKETFSGFRRKNGSVGVRNHIFIVPTVGCVNKLARTLAEKLNRKLPSESVDRALALEHPFGCSQLGGDHEMTRAVLRGFVRHPNAGGVLVVGLGCENNTIDSFREMLGEFDPERVKFLVAQKENDEVSAGLSLLEELVQTASQDVRTEIPVSELVVGLKCGGSDGLSGITANPLVGRFSDWLTARGGSTILSEVPEMFGAETLLMACCRNREVFDKCVKMINDFKRYFTRYGQTIYENPSPGNKAGGISTLEDKSLGCTQKAGSSAVNDVLQIGEHVHEKGLNLLTGPGNDMVACTLLAASGAHLILFTTGRGTPFGSVVPTLKISSNTVLAEHKSGWIDFDAGQMLRDIPIDDAFFRLVLDTASGKEAKNEQNAYEEISIFKDGVTL